MGRENTQTQIIEKFSEAVLEIRGGECIESEMSLIAHQEMFRLEKNAGDI